MALYTIFYICDKEKMDIREAETVLAPIVEKQGKRIVYVDLYFSTLLVDKTTKKSFQWLPVGNIDLSMSSLPPFGVVLGDKWYGLGFSDYGSGSGVKLIEHLEKEAIWEREFLKLFESLDPNQLVIALQLHLESKN